MEARQPAVVEDVEDIPIPLIDDERFRTLDRLIQQRPVRYSTGTIGGSRSPADLDYRASGRTRSIELIPKPLERGRIRVKPF
jgi:hypothetical protein